MGDYASFHELIESALVSAGREPWWARGRRQYWLRLAMFTAKALDNQRRIDKVAPGMDDLESHACSSRSANVHGR